MSNCRWNKSLVLFFVMVIMLCSLACADDKPVSSKAGRVLVSEDYESDLDRKVQIELVTIPDEVRAIGLSTDRARSGKHSVKIDITYQHHFDVYIAPRRNKISNVAWGSIENRIGGFDIEGFNIELKPDRGYLLTLYVWVEQASTHNPVKFTVKTTSNCDLGVVNSQTTLEQIFTEPTNGWVKVEQELTSYMLEQLEAQGYQYEGILLNSISMSSFAYGATYPLKVYIDDITLSEVPMSVVGEYKAKRLAVGKKHTFRSYPNQENTFVWGVCGNIASVGRDWYQPYPGGEAGIRERIKRMGQMADWTLLNLRRHYCSTLLQPGGDLFPGDKQIRYDYLKLALDKCVEYGVGLIPSTLVTQHYIKDASKAECIATMRKLTGMFKDHPGLFAYLLVDEPQPSAAEDFYWGKEQIESMDSNHPCICVCNNVSAVREFAPILPILVIDYYSIIDVPSYDKGAWAVGDLVRYARRSSGAKRIWSISQAFEGSGGPYRTPSPAEFKIEVYSSLAEGASGFLPFIYGGKASYWYDKSFRPHSDMLSGYMIDIFGNPSAKWDEMKKLGPYLRSVGPLLIGSSRLEDDAVTACVKEVIATNGGRKRPVCIARMFKDNKRNARYIVVYNNTRFYTKAFNVDIAKVDAGEKLLDLYSLRQVPLKGNTFAEYLRPGDGRVYAVASASELADIKKEVATERFNIEHDLLELEIRVAGKMGTNVLPAQKAAGDSKILLADGDFTGALAKIAEGMDILEKQNQANIPFSKANTAIEASRSGLGCVNETLSRRMAGIENGFMGTDPGIKEIADRMISLADRFYTMQTQLLQKGPADLACPAEALLKDVQAFERFVNTFFGI